ncbi:MAG TPA: hypothetical protein VIG24_11325, partial [Acidimicrobiia bacterium]
RVGGNLRVSVVGGEQGTQTTTTQPQQPAPTTGGGGGGGLTGGGGGGGGSTPGLPATNTPRQIPGGGELWKVGNDHYLAYKVPGSDIPLVWKVESQERLDVIFPGGAKPDQTMTQDEFKRRSPWVGGLAAELTNTDDNPWQVFVSQFEQHAERKPWLSDPTVQAVMAVAYLEGRTPSQDELAETDWWQDHTAEERELMVAASDSGQAQARELVRELHRQWLGGTFGEISDEQADKWVNRLTSDTDAAGALLNGLRSQRQSLLPDYDENLTWDEIVSPVRNLATNVWGQPFDDDRMLVDLANMRDYTQMTQRLRHVGLQRGVDRVVDDALTDLGSGALGQQVVRSAV